MNSPMPVMCVRKSLSKQPIHSRAFDDFLWIRGTLPLDMVGQHLNNNFSSFFPTILMCSIKILISLQLRIPKIETFI